VSTRARGTVEAFEELAERYDAWYDTAAGRVLFDLEVGALAPLLEDVNGVRLEVGVGSGRFARTLAIDVGLDPAQAPLELAAARGLCVVRGVGEQLPFRDGAFGIVLLVVTLCFADSPAHLLVEVGRVLRPGGRLVIGLVPLDSAWGRFYEEKGRAGHAFYRHARFLSLAEHYQLLGEAGFTIVDSRSTLLQPPTGDPVVEAVRSGVVERAGFVGLAAVHE